MIIGAKSDTRLAGKPNLALEETATSLRVRVFPLQAFTLTHVVKQLAAAHESSPQPVVLGGSSSNELVTELPMLTAVHSEAGGLLSAARDIAPNGSLLLAALHDGPLPVERREEAGYISLGRIDATLGALARNRPLARTLFRNEDAFSMWTNGLTLTAIAAGQEVAIDAIRVEGVADDGGVRHWIVELSLEHEDLLGHWLQLQDAAGKTWGALLPRLGPGGTTRYQLEFELADEAYAGSPGTLERLEVALARHNHGPARALEYVWRVYRYAGIQDAVATIRALFDERHDELRSSPMAAVFAGLVALRAGDIELAQNLAALIRDVTVRPDNRESAILIRPSPPNGLT